jgi:small GTP-binding protein
MRESKRLWLKILPSKRDEFRESIKALCEKGKKPRIFTSVEIPVSVASKTAINAAADVANILSSKEVLTEHLLLGSLKAITKGPVFQVLSEFGVFYNPVYAMLFNPHTYIKLAIRDRPSRLELSDLHLKTLPSELWTLPALRRLILSHNQLESIPEAIGDLQDLQVLDLSFNKLSDLPAALLTLKDLQRLDVRGNPKLELPPELLESESDVPNAHQILNYYFRTTQESSPLNEAKLVLVGRGDVGKTSLVRRLLYSDFNPDEKETPGINITRWNVRLSDESFARLHVWDFGGQEIMHATHQFFLTERSLYVLVLTGRENSADRDAEYWLRMIESFGGRSPVIIVLNKIERFPFEVNRRALERKYPVRAFVQTDCQTGVGIEALRRAIVRETDSLQYLRVAFPARWFQIKSTLAQIKRNFLSFEEYRDVCANLGERDLNWKSSPLSKLQFLPRDAKAVTDWESRDAAWRNVSEGIERAILNLSS